MVGATGYFNPWRFSSRVPFTLLGEIDLVALEYEGEPETSNQLASFVELAWMPFNGTMVRLRHDFIDPDIDFAKDHSHAVTVELDLSLIRHAILQTVVRHAIPATGDGSTDFLIMFRGWF